MRDLRMDRDRIQDSLYAEQGRNRSAATRIVCLEAELGALKRRDANEAASRRRSPGEWGMSSVCISIGIPFQL